MGIALLGWQEALMNQALKLLEITRCFLFVSWWSHITLDGASQRFFFLLLFIFCSCWGLKPWTLVLFCLWVSWLYSKDYVKLKVGVIWVGSFSGVLTYSEDYSWVLPSFQSECSCLSYLWEVSEKVLRRVLEGLWQVDQDSGVCRQE